MTEDKIKIELTKSEAIILFEFVSSFTNDERLEIKNLAEEKVLWTICSRLESILVEPFDENYQAFLAKVIEDVVKGES